MKKYRVIAADGILELIEADFMAVNGDVVSLYRGNILSNTLVAVFYRPTTVLEIKDS